MSQTLQQLGIDRLSIAERLELIGQIWDSLPEAEEGLPPPDWHRDELERRRAAAEADPGAGIPWEVVRARLADRSSLSRSSSAPRPNKICSRPGTGTTDSGAVSATSS